MKHKWIISICVAALLNLGVPSTWAAGGDAPEVVVQYYFSALQEGDIARLKDSMSESFYNKRKALLERNDGYADFLREHYRDVEINMLDINTDNDKAYVTVEMVRAGGEQEKIILVLIKIDEWTWKIDREKY